MHALNEILYQNASYKLIIDIFENVHIQSYFDKDNLSSCFQKGANLRGYPELS